MTIILELMENRTKDRESINLVMIIHSVAYLLVDRYRFRYVITSHTLAIGVDNMFLMVASFRRTSRRLPVGKRMAQTLSDSAISISITALTDALSFGVGAITPIPGFFLLLIRSLF